MAQDLRKLFEEEQRKEYIGKNFLVFKRFNERFLLDEVWE